MNERWTWRQDKVGAAHRVTFEGDLTERSDFTFLAQELPEETTFDLGAVTRINSSGVRLWLAFLSALDATGKRYSFERCSPAVVSQMNTVSAFSAGAKVKSVLAPYYCSMCRRLHLEVVETPPGVHFQVKDGLLCSVCGLRMEFDEIPESFLAFRQPQSSLEPLSRTSKQP
ncbi:MAG: hypothetical protein ACT4TC_07235 [Myxococcaceae bacterium]